MDYFYFLFITSLLQLFVFYMWKIMSKNDYDVKFYRVLIVSFLPIIGALMFFVTAVMLDFPKPPKIIVKFKDWFFKEKR